MSRGRALRGPKGTNFRIFGSTLAALEFSIPDSVAFQPKQSSLTLEQLKLSSQANGTDLWVSLSSRCGSQMITKYHKVSKGLKVLSL